MNPTTPSLETLSPWWRHAVILTLIGGFAVLIWLVTQSYSQVPPIPETVIGPTGETHFTQADIVARQQVFLKYGLMDNGSIWGHGAYLGPDFSAAYLHHLVEDTRAFLNQPLFLRLEWLRLPGDLVFIGFGVVPMVIAALRCYAVLRPDRRPAQTPTI